MLFDCGIVERGRQRCRHWLPLLPPLLLPPLLLPRLLSPLLPALLLLAPLLLLSCAHLR